MKKEVKRAFLEILFSVTMLINTIALMLPNGISSKISAYFLSQVIQVLI